MSYAIVVRIAKKYILPAVVLMTVMLQMMGQPEPSAVHDPANNACAGYAFCANTGKPDLPCEPGSSYTAIPSSNNASASPTLKEGGKFINATSEVKATAGHVSRAYRVSYGGFLCSVSLSKLRRFNI